ncbi:hypothetical protein ACFOMD_03770 [Sphingoaurantiacus capsulatus]|uniref:Uncharacterized protein n=1 Tax=Sphingoaurantiacus capsulatus TaxID=1771310 RepID=A0ABV7X8Y2_9SPHN
MSRHINDNESAAASGVSPPDAHGQAALFLVESLIHGLVARSVLSVADALEIVDIASEVKEEIGPELGDTPAELAKSLALLAAIERSLAIDLE